MLPTSRPPLASRSFALLVMGQFLQSLGFATTPLVPVLLTALGAARQDIGTAAAAGAIGGLMCRPLVGIALDRVGRGPTILVGTFLLGLATMTVGLTGGVVAAVIANRLVFGAGVAALFTGYYALASDVIPAERRTEGIALFGIAGLLPLTVNPLVAMFSLDAAQMTWLFAVAGLGVWLSGAFVWRVAEARVLPTPRAAAEHGAPGTLQRLWSPALRPAWLSTAIFATVIAAFFAFSTVAAESHGVEGATTLWFAFTAAAVGVRVVGARLPDRIGPTNLYAPALGLYCAAMLVIAGSDRITDVWLAGALAGVAHGYGFPVITSLVVTRAPESIRGTALSVYTGLWDLTALLFAPLLGRLSDRAGDAVMFSGLVVALVVALGVWAAAEHRWGPAQVRS